MPTLDFEFRLLAALLTIAAFVYSTFRRPGAAVLMGYANIGLGGAVIWGELRFAQIMVILQVLTVCYLAAKFVSRQGIDAFGKMFATPPPLFTLGVLAVWVKIMVNCLADGFDPFQVFSLRMSVYAVILPSFIFLFAILLDGSEKAFQDLIFGAVLVSFCYNLPVIPSILIEDRIMVAISQAERLTTYGQDTINGGRMFFFGCFGCMTAAICLTKKTRYLMVLWVVTLANLAFVVLNGTRQYVIALALAFLILGFTLKASRKLMGASIIIILVIGIYLGRGAYMGLASSERFTQDSVSMELEAGRGHIWSEAFSVMLEHPIAGVGFRHFGTEFVVVSREDGTVTVQKDNAHGFLQEVFVEHGLILGLVVAVGWVMALRGLFFNSVAQKGRATAVGLATVLLMLELSESFSSSVSNSLGFHLLAVAGLAIRLNQVNPRRPGVKNMRQAVPAETHPLAEGVVRPV